MPRYTIGGKTINSARDLTDDEIDEIANEEGLPAGTSPVFAPMSAGPFKYTRGPDDSEYDLKDRVPKPPSLIKRAFEGTASTLEKVPFVGAPLAGLVRTAAPGAMRGVNLEKVGSEPGIAGSNVKEAPRYLGAFAGSLLGGGPVGATVGAGLGGAGGRALEFGLDLLPGGDPSTVPRNVGEVVSEMGSAGKDMAALEATGQVLGRGLPKAASAARHPVDTTKAVLAAGKSAAAKLSPAALPANVAVALRRSPLGKAVQAEQAAADLQAINEAPPLERLDPAARGTLIGEAERQALIARSQQAEKLYSPMKDIQVSIRDLLDDDFDLLIKEAGAKIPPNVANPLRAVKAARSKLPAVREGEIVSSPDLDAALSKLDNIPFSEIRKLRTEVGTVGRRAQGNVKFAADSMYRKLSAFLEDAAEGAGMRPEWDAANSFYKGEVVLNHKVLGKGDTRKPSLGKQIQKKAPEMATTEGGDLVPVGGTPEKMHQVLSPANPQDVIGVHRALVPQGDWVTPALAKSGQHAFDNLVEQAVESRFPIKDGNIDPTQISSTIRDRVGVAAWEEMKNLSSPAQRTRLENIERVGAAFEKLAAPPLTPMEIFAPGAAAGVGSLVGGGVGAAVGTAVGAYRTFGRLKPAALKWAIQHPARTEILIHGMSGTVSPFKLNEVAARNISNVIRLYEMDTSRPPAAVNQ